MPLERLSLYNKICYELQLSEGTNYREARQYCRKHSGDLVHTMPDPAFKFLVGQLERQADQLTTKLLWIGVQKVPDTQAWNWVNGEYALRTDGEGASEGEGTNGRRDGRTHARTDARTDGLTNKLVQRQTRTVEAKRQKLGQHYRHWVDAITLTVQEMRMERKVINNHERLRRTDTLRDA